jgi:hypothetical protein
LLDPDDWDEPLLGGGEREIIRLVQLTSWKGGEKGQHLPVFNHGKSERKQVVTSE